MAISEFTIRNCIFRLSVTEQSGHKVNLNQDKPGNHDRGNQ